ncbi:MULTISPECIES: flagellar type III secretion system pore protein FliP [Providencia]|uniref:flagellar type III secretion system pore protein FliP n=1 Tax=Providencia TaxID=586 RepID=UPI000BCDA09E|nr:MULTISPECIES: flagellar type III secretion system pore protein FliP [Providencia]MBW3105588.1 flagellar type III secretion system pore protein FliP [Providencia rettgeri]PCQ37064.1 flagellar biosynthetic protein FliP [Providencia rettgeri]QLQ66381.1 flagellar type III secretion system pore protein FliP [Providencia rettgeri]URR23550.1 flagellar type III secretion system pore protein FliP [Providencia rettgeri]BBU95440.1 flagellar biosynthetic protein FliP [Providencia rettgeri]
MLPLKSLLTITALLFLLPNSASAALPAVISHSMADGGQTWSLPVQTLLFLTLLGFIPALLLMMTSFTRIIIVLGLLRNALGTPSAPPNQVLLGLALFLTFFVMSPVADQVYREAYQPFSEDKISLETALEKGTAPLRTFMLGQTRESDLALFARIAKVGEIQEAKDVPLRILVPAFITSELKTAFQIGFTIFIPFLIIDLVVASVLMALGMMMVPPATVSLPFKLMLFVLVDGWQLLLGSLSQSFFN